MAEETVKSSGTAEMELQIKEAMRSRINHFKEQANSLTFEGVRRLLEKDLGLEECALDKQKRYVKQCLQEFLDDAADDNTSKDSNSREVGEKHTHLTTQAEELPEEDESKTNIKEPGSEDEEKMEDSPVMGLLTGKKKTKPETEETTLKEKKEVPSESSIKTALWNRASYIRGNLENITLASLRRLLEKDLGLDKFALDSYKQFISKQIDEVLQSAEDTKPKKESVKKRSQGKASKNSRADENSESSDRESDMEDEDEVRPKKKISAKRKMQNSEVPTKRKRREKEVKASGKKQRKPTVEDNSDAEGTENASDDSRSQSSAEKPVKKKEVPTPAYGKNVEHLRSVIKSCGMSVPPVIYKKVKQVPESKREAELIKELKEILSKEGLSSNPSEKEIKEVKKRKERAKELEGIDMSNIVSSSRRRSTATYVPPPKPKIPVDSDNSDADGSDEDDEEDDDDDVEEENDEEDGDNNADDGSQSEEVNDDKGEDSE
ncbi:hypothetical protein M5689_025286 [Euphorbia peplus]|nr:hypothetical protein M5689_025286 [Euphorbia peplus]